MEKRGKRTRNSARNNYKSIVSRNCSKQAQFYLIAALIIATVIIGLATITNYIKTKKEPVKFYDLSSELSEEGSRVIDYGIYNEEDIPARIENFTDEYFIKYAEKKERGTEIVFVYGDRENVTVSTYTTENTGTITVDYGTAFSTVLSGENKYVANRTSFTPLESEGYTVKVKIFGVEYSFYLKQGENFFFVINKKTEEETYIAESQNK